MPDPIWLKWIGLPHQIGADPNDGQAACCLRMTVQVLRSAGKQPPEDAVIDRWIALAKEGQWPLLKAAFLQHCIPTQERELWSVVLITNGPREALGLGIVIPDDLLLFPHHRQGVVTAPLRLLRPLTHYTLR